MPGVAPVVLSHRVWVAVQEPVAVKPGTQMSREPKLTEMRCSSAMTSPVPDGKIKLPFASTEILPTGMCLGPGTP